MASSNSTARKNTRDQEDEEFRTLVAQLTKTQKSLLSRYMRYIATLKPGSEAMGIAKFVETMPKELIDQFRPLVAGLEVQHG